MRACAVILIIVLSFVVSRPVTEALLWILVNFWTLYGAYIQLWLEQHHSFVIVLCSICGAVAALYVTVLPSLVQSTIHKDESAMRAVGPRAPAEKVTGISVTGMFMSREEPTRTPPEIGTFGHLQQ